VRNCRCSGSTEFTAVTDLKLPSHGTIEFDFVPFTSPSISLPPIEDGLFAQFLLQFKEQNDADNIVISSYDEAKQIQSKIITFKLRALRTASTANTFTSEQASQILDSWSTDPCLQESKQHGSLGAMLAAGAIADAAAVAISAAFFSVRHYIHTAAIVEPADKDLSELILPSDAVAADSESENTRRIIFDAIQVRQKSNSAGTMQGGDCYDAMDVSVASFVRAASLIVMYSQISDKENLPICLRCMSEPELQYAKVRSAYAELRSII
jgi:hypothetical protein